MRNKGELSGVLVSCQRGVGAKERNEISMALGEHSGSIGGRNCYPIETKGKGRRRMDVTSSGTGSPIIGFMIGVPPSTFTGMKIFYSSVLIANL